MSESFNPEVTLLLRAAGHDPRAANKLLPLVYEELRALARSRLKNERAGHTLQATALVHEAYVKLIGSNPVTWENRAHFFGACANAMRQILVDHARSKGAQKRGGGLKAEALSSNDVADTRDVDLILAIDECLEKLKAEDERAAEVVQLRFFGGLEMNEIAEALGTSERTVHREWAFARVRLLQLLGEPGASETKA